MHLSVERLLRVDLASARILFVAALHPTLRPVGGFMNRGKEIEVGYLHRQVYMYTYNFMHT